MATNIQMEQMLASLQKHLDRGDMIGYAAARNTRVLEGELVEYFAKRNELAVKYGEPEKDGEGNETGRVSIQPMSDNFVLFIEELGKFAEIEHEPNLFKIDYAEAIGNLSGSELLDIDWMFEDKEVG